MLFGVKLASEVYPPWKGSYIDYDGLKKLLKEEGDGEWTENDESRFCEALEGELKKVYTFQSSKYEGIMDRLGVLEKETSVEDGLKDLDTEQFQRTLEESLSEATELDNFMRLNYTGFMKIVKKHDKLHPQYPSVRSMLEVRLKELPFHSEEYSPILYRISFLYNVLRSNFNTVSTSLASVPKLSSVAENDEINMSFKSFKFWIHNDNLMEVKTRILRHLPVLVYASAPTETDDLVDRFESDVLNADEHVQSSDSGSHTDEEGTTHENFYDPVITTIYFDNEHFDLYNNKLLKRNRCPTLRFRWTGKFADKPDVFLEKRMFIENKETGDSDFEEIRLLMKPKFISGFIFDNDNTYKKNVLKKLEESRTPETERQRVEKNFNEMQEFINEEHLQPVVRTTYTRTAFQIPGDDRIRVTIDSNIMYIREDSFDKTRPIRDPHNWHRNDIDSSVSNPMKFLRAGEYSKFPYSVMEIKVKNPSKTVETGSSVDISGIKLPKKHGGWINELTNSHLVKEVPKFSLYIQGVAALFAEEEKLDILPFWLPELDSDIRKDPKQAYEDEQKKITKQKEIQHKLDGMRRLSKISRPNSSVLEQQPTQSPGAQRVADIEDHESSDEEVDNTNKAKRNKKKKKTKTSRSKLTFMEILGAGRSSKLTGFDSEEEEVELPQGVKKPLSYLKNAGPVKVEAKVWLANERTFIRWLSVTVLLSVLTFSISNSVRRAEFPNLARTLGNMYFIATVFCALWSYYSYRKRLRIIRERSGEFLDAPLGPQALALFLFFSLIINFVAVFRATAKKHEELSTSSQEIIHPHLEAIFQFFYKIVGSG
ncbi:Vacuolar transporter chaperone complex subunit 2 [Nakaseomyces bracarensis]|uniref:Vacuolar transporter chaperone complex subunit 2 n=1 Tax=Nakaseomyces bracarensis TaxID=273131 RepID=A0ABR4NLV6_9SACH